MSTSSALSLVVEEYTKYIMFDLLRLFTDHKLLPSISLPILVFHFLQAFMGYNESRSVVSDSL